MQLLELEIEQILNAAVVQVLEEHFGLEQAVDVVEQVLGFLIYAIQSRLKQITNYIAKLLSSRDNCQNCTLIALDDHGLYLIDLHTLALDVLLDALDALLKSEASRRLRRTVNERSVGATTARRVGGVHGTGAVVVEAGGGKLALGGAADGGRSERRVVLGLVVLLLETSELAGRLLALLDELVEVEASLGQAGTQLELLADPLLCTNTNKSYKNTC